MSIFASIQEYQRVFSEKIASTLHHIQATDGSGATLTLVSIGFLYGLFHAIGPGHGKLVITGYMMADHTTLKRGIVLAIVSSVLQAVTAIVLVMTAFYGFAMAKSQIQFAADGLEIASFMLILLLGAALVFRGARKMQHVRRKDNSHVHIHGAHCNHTHAPAADMLKKTGLREMMFMALSIGIRPCSGAIILLFFACLLGVYAAGILATFAMAAGTAIATSSFAILAVYSKQFALRIASRSEKKLAYIEASLTILAGMVIMLAASLFLWSALPSVLNPNAPVHPLMHRS